MNLYSNQTNCNLEKVAFRIDTGSLLVLKEMVVLAVSNALSAPGLPASPTAVTAGTPGRPGTPACSGGEDRKMSNRMIY